MLELIAVSLLVLIIIAQTSLTVFLVRKEKQRGVSLQNELNNLKLNQATIVEKQAKEVAVQILSENAIKDDEEVRTENGEQLISITRLEQNPVLFERFSNNFKGWDETFKR